MVFSLAINYVLNAFPPNILKIQNTEAIFTIALI